MTFEKIIRFKEKDWNVDIVHYNTIIGLIGDVNESKRRSGLEKLIESLEIKSWEQLAKCFVRTREAEGFRKALTYCVFPQVELFGIEFTFENAAKMIDLALIVGLQMITMMG